MRRHPTALGFSSFRRGAVLVAVMVCLTVITILCGTLLKLSLAEQKQVRLDECRLQAEWLAESGLERAAARLATAGDYAGETWELRAAELGVSGAATVRISVDRKGDTPRPRSVTVHVEYNREGQQTVRHTKSVHVMLNVESPKEQP